MGRLGLLLLFAGCTVANPDYLPGAGGPGGPGLEPGQLPGGDLSSSGADSGVLDFSTGNAPDLTSPHGCGDPGNPGNGQGVGKYCTSSAQCQGQPANFCATVFDPNAHFCTMGCQQGGTNCGDGASCLCSTGGCGCIPDACVPPTSTPDMAMGGQCLAGNQSCVGVLAGCCGGLLCSGLLGRCCAAKNWQCDADHPCCTGSCQNDGTCP